MGHFKQYLNDPATQGNPKRADAEKGIAEARAKLPRIQVSVDLAGAEIFLDNAKIGTSPMGEALDVKPGNHTLEAKKDGKSARATVDPVAGKITMVDLRINPGTTPAVVPPPPLPPTGAPATSAPPGPIAVPAATTMPPEELPPETTGSKPGKWAAVAIAGGGLAVIGLGVGVGFVVSANQKDSDVASIAKKIRDDAVYNAPPGRQNNPCATPVPERYVGSCSKLITKRDERDSAKSTATVGFVAAGVGAAVGGFGAFMYFRAKSENTAFQMAPILTPDTQGMAFTGSF